MHTEDPSGCQVLRKGKGRPQAHDHPKQKKWQDCMQNWPYHCMPSASIASNISQPLDVQCVESAQISFNSVFVNLLTQSSELFLTKLSCPFVFYTLQGVLADVLA